MPTYFVLSSYVGGSTRVPRRPKPSLEEAIAHAQSLMIDNPITQQLLVVEVMGVVERQTPPIAYRPVRDGEFLEK